MGIHDIPELEQRSKEFLYQDANDPSQSSHPLGWIACTTDEILADKPNLYDIVIELSSSHSRHSNPAMTGRTRPVIRVSGSNREIKATQRDWRRFQALRHALAPATQANANITATHPSQDDDDDELSADSSPLLQSFTSIKDRNFRLGDEEEERVLVEPISWSEVAYHGFMWWATAGQQIDMTRDEAVIDHSLLGGISDTALERSGLSKYQDEVGDEEPDQEERESDEETTQNPEEITQNSTSYISQRRDASLEVEIVAYFQRITRALFDTVKQTLLETSDMDEGDGDDDDDGDEGNSSNTAVADADSTTSCLAFTSDSIKAMGLDVWSGADTEFLIDFVSLWFGREARIEGGEMDWCGLKRIC